MKEITYGYRWKRQPGVNPELLSATISAGKTARNISRIVLPAWVLDCEFSGMGRYRVRTGSASWHVRLPWTVHLYPPNTPFWEDKRYGDKWLNSGWIMFLDRRKDLNRLHRTCGYVRFFDRQERIGQLIRKAAETGKQYGEHGFWNAQAALCEALNLILNARLLAGNIYDIAGETGRSEMSVLASEVNAFLKDHLAEKIMLSDIAAHLHVSVSSLAHRYRQVTGSPPRAALARLRVDNAKALLLKGYPLKAVAAQLGFADAFHLSKTFKRLEGVSPRGFVRRPG